MWITMWKLYIPMVLAVDNSVENSESYPQEKFVNVDN